ncbi:MAG: AAA family ATPase [Burkholderiaceae bacterium]
MITEIQMDAVASYKQVTSLVTDKKINLVYGLNGAGKSTISNFLYGSGGEQFSRCKTLTEHTPPVLVYNQKFIQDNFFVSDNLKGIFSLSKENKVAKEKISQATNTLKELEDALQKKRALKTEISDEFSGQKQIAYDEVWNIKVKYSGGDRVLEYCLDGLKGQKEKLFSHLQAIAKLTVEPKKTIQNLREEVDSLKGDSAQVQIKIPLLTFLASDVEADAVFGQSILGNADSEVAALIDKIGNADWVKQGLVYLPKDVDQAETACPFCQENTITSQFTSKIRAYFDESYRKQIEHLESLKNSYVSALEKLTDISVFTSHTFSHDRKELLSTQYQVFVDVLRNNLVKIKEKIKGPKTIQTVVGIFGCAGGVQSHG